VARQAKTPPAGLPWRLESKHAPVVQLVRTAASRAADLRSSRSWGATHRNAKWRSGLPAKQLISRFDGDPVLQSLRRRTPIGDGNCPENSWPATKQPWEFDSTPPPPPLSSSSGKTGYWPLTYTNTQRWRLVTQTYKFFSCICPPSGLCLDFDETSIPSRTNVRADSDGGKYVCRHHRSAHGDLSRAGITVS